MKREVCPNCGGVLVDESLGWRCKSCRGFISLQDGKFYEYVEKPFMPPQTNADRIRAMSDEELAEFMAERYSNERTANILGSLIGEGYVVTEAMRRALHEKMRMQWLDWLRQPVKEGEGE